MNLPAPVCGGTTKVNFVGGVDEDVIEALCKAFKPADKVISVLMYVQWLHEGKTRDIFCGNRVMLM